MSTEVEFIGRLCAKPKSAARDRAVRFCINTLTRRRESIAHFMHWPALLASIDADIARLKALL